MQNRFNLIDEPWIPVIGKGRASLGEIFSDPTLPALGGNPVQKIALTKLLLAIGQAACTPESTEELEKLDVETFHVECLRYLEKWYDRFWLYGEKPFLQMPSVKKLIEERKQRELKSAPSAPVRKKEAAEKQAELNAFPRPIGMGFYPDMPAENNTILSQFQIAETSDPAGMALFVVTLMNFALGGKRIEKNLTPLSPGFMGKSVSAKAGPSIGNYIGYLHSFLTGPALLDTLLLNLLSREQISANPYWKFGLGTPPWELMPEGETCPVATNLNGSYMATLVALSRFVLLEGEGIYYVEGLQYPSHKEGWREPGMMVQFQDNQPKVVWVDPDKRPWRELPSMLAFLGNNANSGYECQFIKYGLARAKQRHQQIGIWSGGLRVSANAGDQSVKQDNDFVESLILFDSTAIDELWYSRFQQEMARLDRFSKMVYSATKKYFASQNMDGGALASNATALFWQLSERRFQELVDACYEPARLPAIGKTIAALALQSFDAFCPKETARQIDAWAACRPDLSRSFINN
ncbi:MAG: type I-E CRISPR-associated protein Cse1/CasA [Chlorobiaceae bacterium]|nr:type I-E CRISPR-associated protein Cse1/CasA [Chlorobiaceae bacterium]